MATVTARKVDDDDYALLRESADAHGRSVSEELRLLIAQHARRMRRAQFIRHLKQRREKSTWRLPEGMTSLDLLREERNSW